MKKMMVNCAVCDMRSVSEETLKNYEQITVNAATVFVTPEKKDKIVLIADDPHAFEKDTRVEIRLADGHVLVLHLRRQLVLQAVDVDEDAIELLFIGFELPETLLAQLFPGVVCIRE